MKNPRAMPCCCSDIGVGSDLDCAANHYMRRHSSFLWIKNRIHMTHAGTKRASCVSLSGGVSLLPGWHLAASHFDAGKQAGSTIHHLFAWTPVP